MTAKFTNYTIKTVLCAYTIGLICAMWLVATGDTYTAKTIVCACGLVGEILVTVVSFSFFRKMMTSIQKFLVGCDACGIVAFSLFLIGNYQETWMFYALLFVAFVTYGDLLKMSTLFSKKN